MQRNELKFLSIATIGEGKYPAVFVNVCGRIHTFNTYDSIAVLLEVVEKEHEFSGNTNAAGSGPIPANTTTATPTEQQALDKLKSVTQDDEIPF